MKLFKKLLVLASTLNISMILGVSQVCAPLYAEEPEEVSEVEYEEIIEEVGETEIVEEIDEEKIEDTEVVEEELEDEEIEVEDEATPEEVERAKQLERELKEAEKALNSAKVAYDDAMDKKEKGSLGFFEAMGATAAVTKLLNAKYADYTEIGDWKDATSLDNMRETFDLIREGNAYRAGEGKAALKVTHELMAIAQSNTNISKSLMYHSFQYNVCENLSWYYADPYDGWYVDEKAVVDYLAKHPNATKQQVADALGFWSTDDVQTGHYYNLVDSYYKVTGFGIAKDRYGRKNFCQVFTNKMGTAYTVDQYEAMVDSYCESIDQAIANYEKAQNNYAEALAAYNKERVYTINFDANGGESSRSYMYMVCGESYGTLPTATKDNCSFVGWMTENGEYVNENSVFDQEEDLTLVAIYEEGGYGVPTLDPIQTDVESIALNKNTATLNVGETMNLVATINPEEAFGYTLTWTSSNDDVATVKDGKVTARKAGNVEITVSSDNGVAATCKVQVNKNASTLEGYSLSLNGDIALNFHMSLSDKDVANSKMNFYLDGNLIDSVNTTNAKKSGEYYVYSCHVSAKDMANEITAEFVGTKTVQYKATIEGYANSIIQNANKYDAHSVEIVKAMLTYGKYVQLYFDYNTDHCPSYANTLQNVDLSWVDTQLVPTVNGELSVNFAGARLRLTSKLELKLYFIGEVESVKVNGQTKQLETEGKYRVLTISGIDNPAEMYTISTNCFTLKYGVYSYAQKSLQTSNEKLNNMVKALVAFNTVIHQ